jgi:hypothetical protein
MWRGYSLQITKLSFSLGLQRNSLVKLNRGVSG